MDLIKKGLKMNNRVINQMKVRELSIEDEYFVVKANETVLDLAKKITDTGIPDAVVVDEENKVLGVTDDFDIVTKVVAQGKDPATVKVEEIMFQPPHVYEDTDLERVDKIMREFKASIVPVVNKEKQIIGVVTVFDLQEGMEKQSTRFSKTWFSKFPFFKR